MPSDSRPPRKAMPVVAEVERLRASEELLRDENAELLESQILLEESRDDYAELYDLAALAQLTLAANGVIRNANWAAAELFELERNLLIRRSFRTLVHTDDRSRLVGLAAPSPVGPAPSREVRVVLPSGTVVPVEIWARPSARRQGMLHLTLLDLRSRERDAWQKEELIASERSARRASNSKDQFIAMLSHELRTPLTPILAAASKWESAAELSEDVRRAFRVIRRNAVAETRLVDDLLDATGILRGKLRITRRATDLHTLLSDCVESFKADAETRSVRLIYAPEADQHVTWADPLRLRQVFTNLLKNALKATPAEGSITVRTWSSASRVAVEVEDTGVGFEPGEAARLFVPFDQLGRDLEAGGGLGLGLAISKGIVDLHEGALSAMSPGPGQGARFVVELALSVEQELPSAPRIPTEPPRASALVRRYRLLLVEDHDDTAEMMQELLESEGYAVERARSVAEALAVDISSIDAIISDLGLPDGSGHTLLKRFEKAPLPPAIALSGRGMQADLEASAAAGFELHLTKPVSFESLLESLSKVLSRAEGGLGSEGARGGQVGL